MAQTFALPWYLCELFPVEVGGLERIFGPAREAASGNLNPRGAILWDEAVHNDLEMGYGCYRVLVSMYFGKCSDGHRYGG